MEIMLRNYEYTEFLSVDRYLSDPVPPDVAFVSISVVCLAPLTRGPHE